MDSVLEVEVKVKVEIDSIEGKLSSLGYTRGTTVYEYDTYFDGKNLDMRAADKALRIRKHQDVETGKTKYVLNFKGPKIDDTTMTREETQFEVPSLEQAQLVLNGLDFFAAGYVEKTRIHYKKDDITCCLDKVTGLGDFLEIEIMADAASYDDAVSRINDLLVSLDLSMENTVRHSYLSMLQK